ncbi:hypothetical protein D3C80_918310 [compost metagenome]
MAIESAGISIEKTRAGKSQLNKTLSTKFIANVVLPIDGRAATIIKSPDCMPDVLLSSSIKPDVKPVMLPSICDSSFNLSKTSATTALIGFGP